MALSCGLFETKDQKGNLPLHYSLTINYENFGKDECIISLVYRKNRSALRSRMQDGAFPLHVACGSSGRHTSMIRRLMDRFPKAIGLSDNNGRLPIHHLCSHSNSAKSFSHVLDDFSPILDRVYIIRRFIQEKHYSASSRDAKGMLPLHVACESSNDAQVVALLLRVYPQGAREKDHSGKYPIHFAAASCPKLIPLLLKSWPESIDISGLLHLVCRYSSCSRNDDDENFDEEGIVKLIKTGPQHASTCYQSSKMLPLHQACASCLSMAVLLALVEAFPDAVKTLDENGDLPVHHVVRSPKRCPIVVRYQHSVYPQGYCTEIRVTIYPFRCVLDRMTHSLPYWRNWHQKVYPMAWHEKLTIKVFSLQSFS